MNNGVAATDDWTWIKTYDEAFVVRTPVNLEHEYGWTRPLFPGEEQADDQVDGGAGSQEEDDE